MDVVNLAQIPVYRLEDCVEGSPFFITRMRSKDIFVKEFGFPHRHNGYSIDILLKGSIRQSVDFRTYEVKAPAIMLMEPDQIHQHLPDDDCEMINIGFTQDFLVPEIQGVVSCWHCVFSSGQIQLKEEEMHEVMSYARMIYNEYYSDRPRKEAVIRNLLNAFIIACGRIAQPTDSMLYTESAQSNMVRQFKVLVDTHYREKQQVAAYAELLFVTPGHLNDTVKGVIGRTAKQIIDEKRITEAKRLLYWGRHSVKQIAAQLNFEDDAYFNRFFKKHTSLTPTTFQKSIREKYN